MHHVMVHTRCRVRVSLRRSQSGCRRAEPRHRTEIGVHGLHAMLLQTNGNCADSSDLALVR